MIIAVVLIALFALVVCYAALVVASDADDMAERMRRDEGNHKGAGEETGTQGDREHS